MQPTNFPEQTGILGAGDNPNTGDLPFVIATDPHTPGVVFLVSCWEPSEEELAQIAANKKIYLAVMANPARPTQPPVSLHGHNPMKDYGEHSFVPIPSIKEQIDNIIDKVKDGAQVYKETEQYWQDLAKRYEDIFLDSDTDILESKLQQWHTEADEFIAKNPHYEQRHKDLLTN